MSTLTHAESGRDVAVVPRARLVSGPLALVFLSAFGILTSFYLLLSVSPMYAASAGAGTAGAGLVTGVLMMGTVAAELASSSLMKRYGYKAALAAGAVLLGVPTLALLAAGSLPVIVAVSLVRGFGFGLSTVVTAALAAELLPPERRGEGLGLYGAVDSAPAILALPAGIWLAGHYGFPVVLIITAATALVPLAVFPWLRGVGGLRGAGALGVSAGAGQPAGLRDGLRDRAQVRPALIFATSAVAGGVVVSFLPLAREYPAT
jgi:MFS family permease